MMEDNNSRTLFTGNLSPEVTEDLLYELFLQAGPLEKVCIPKNPKGPGGHRSFGFVTFRHAVSARYATDLMQGVALFGRQLQVRSRTQNSDQSDGRSAAVKLLHQNSEPGTSGMYQHQNNGPNILHASRMMTMQAGNMTSSRQAPAATELIVLDSDSSPSSFSSPQKNRDYNSTQQRGPYRSFSDGPAFMTPPPHGNFFGPPIRYDGQQQRFWTQPSSNAGVASALQDPWKQFEQFRNAAQEYDRRHQHPHHQRHHQSWSPYGGKNQQRRF